MTSGHPVNPLLGAKVLPGETDIALPGPLPFILSRTYSSYRTKTIGAPTGVACSVCPGGVTSGHPVNPLLGAKVLPGETDIALPGPLPFIHSRTNSSYRTKTPAPVGSLGPGWKMPADIRLQLRDNTLILSDNGRRSQYFEHL